MNYDVSHLNPYQVQGYDAIEAQPQLIQPRSKTSQFFATIAQIILSPFTVCCTCYTLDPNQSSIISSFGEQNKIEGTPGVHGKFFWEKVQKVSTAVQDLRLEQIKVNDQKKNPVIASAVVYWRVSDVAKFRFTSVDAFKLLNDQAKVALREVCSNHPFDNAENQPCLGKPSDAMAQELKNKLEAKIGRYGIEIDSFQFTDVCYEPALQEAMLQNQRMEAIVRAKENMSKANADITVQTILETAKGLNVEFSDEQKKEFAMKLTIAGSNFSQGGGTHTLNLNKL